MITFARRDLAQALTQLKRASKATQPVLIEAGPHYAVLTVASGDYILTRIVPAIVGDPVSMLLPCWKLEAQVRAIRQPELMLEVEYDKVLLRAGNLTRRWRVEDPDTFIRMEQGAHLGECLLDNVSWIAKSIATCTAREDHRPVLQCVYVQVADGLVTLVAADGFRLTMATQSIVSGGSWTALIPANFWKLAADLAGKEPLRLILCEGSQALFTSAQGSLLVPVVQGLFPEYKNLIPAPATSFQIDRALFAEAIAAISSFASARSDIVRLLVADGVLAVRAYDEESDMTVTILVTGGNTKIAFRCKCLREMLQAFVGSDVIDCGTTSQNSPGLFTARDSSLRVVMMPMFIQW